MDEQDYLTLVTMQKYGGSFVQALAQLGHRADPANLQIIKDAWPAYWRDYQAMALRKSEE